MNILIFSDKLDKCNDALYQSTERQRSVRLSVGELLEKSDTCLALINNCYHVTKDIHSVAMETNNDVKPLDCNLQGISNTLIKKYTKFKVMYTKVRMK